MRQKKIYLSKRKRYNKNTFRSLKHILNKKIYNSVCMMMMKIWKRFVQAFIFMYISPAFTSDAIAAAQDYEASSVGDPEKIWFMLNTHGFNDTKEFLSNTKK